MSDQYFSGTIGERAEALATLGATLNDVVVPEANEQMIKMMELLVESVRRDVIPRLAVAKDGNVIFLNPKHDNDNEPPRAA